MATDAEIASESEAALLLQASDQPVDQNDLPPCGRRVFRRLLIAVLLFITAVAMTIPVRPRLILDASHRDASKASYFTGFVDCLQAILSIFSSPLFGAVSDVTGRKPILVLSHLGELVGLLLVARFPTNLWMQFPAYLIIALTNSYITTSNTIIADISSFGNMAGSSEQAHVSSTTNYGHFGAVLGFCFLIGPALGGFIESKFYLASSFHVACVLIVIAMVYVTIFLPETKPANVLDQNATSTESSTNQSRFQRAIADTSATTVRLADAVRATDINPIPRVRRFFGANEALRWIAFAIATSSLAHGGLNAILFLYANERLGWETKETGYFLSMIGLSLLISQGLLAPLAVQYLGEVPTILLGYSLSAVHYLFYAMARTSAMMYMGLFVGMFSFTADPALKGLLARQVSIDCQGGLQGSISALATVVRPFSPLFAAALFGYGNSIGTPGLPFVAMSFISSISVLFARIAFWKPGLK